MSSTGFRCQFRFRQCLLVDFESWKFEMAHTLGHMYDLDSNKSIFVFCWRYRVWIRFRSRFNSFARKSKQSHVEQFWRNSWNLQIGVLLKEKDVTRCEDKQLANKQSWSRFWRTQRRCPDALISTLGYRKKNCLML